MEGDPPRAPSALRVWWPSVHRIVLGATFCILIQQF